jgi:hypothetical protein
MQKDLGPETAKIASKMTLYDTGKSWQASAPDAVPPDEAAPDQTPGALSQAGAQ